MTPARDTDQSPFAAALKPTLGPPLMAGHGAALPADRIVAVARPGSAPVQRRVSAAAALGLLIDVTYGRRTRSIVFLDSGHVLRVALSPETLIARWQALAGLPAGTPTAGGSECSSS